LHDTAERRDLLELVRRSSNSTWWVTAKFQRSLGTQSGITSDAFSVNRPPDHLAGSAGVVSGVLFGKTVSCSIVSAGYTCAKAQPATTGSAAVPLTTNAAGSAANGDPGAYLAAVTSPSRRWYRVVRLADRTIADRTAECFRVVHQGGEPAPLGNETDYCYTAQGIPLHWAQFIGDLTSTLTTTAISTHVTDGDLETLAGGRPPAAVAIPTSTRARQPSRSVSTTSSSLRSRQ
jgi:hypothetical protein